jgi:hypothetical protein
VNDVRDLLKSARAPSLDLAPADLSAAWEDLAQDDVPRAYKALARLSAAPEKAVPFLRDRFGELTPPNAAAAPRLVADLASDKFAVRQNASNELEKLGESARTALEKALASKPPLDLQQRIEQLLEKLATYTPDHLRLLRSMQVLEQAGTPTARQALEILAKGAAGPRLAEEARLSLQRLPQRRSLVP